MQMKIKTLVLLAIATLLTACASEHKQLIENQVVTNPAPGVSEKTTTENPTTAISTPSHVNAVTNQPIAGNFEQRMDSIDKSKLSKALDKALGKMTEWTNDMTGITYRIVPTQKIVVDGNQFCRKYTITVIKNQDSQELSGSACVTEDGNWHSVSNV